MSPLHHLPCNSVTLLHCQFIFTAPQKIINPIASAKGQKPRRPYAPWHSPRTACSLSCLILVNKLCNPVQGRKTQPMEKLSMAGETSSNPHSYWVAGSTFRRRRSSKLSVRSCCSSRSSEATPDPPGRAGSRSPPLPTVLGQKHRSAGAAGVATTAVSPSPRLNPAEAAVPPLPADHAEPLAARVSPRFGWLHGSTPALPGRRTKGTASTQRGKHLPWSCKGLRRFPIGFARQRTKPS